MVFIAISHEDNLSFGGVLCTTRNLKVHQIHMPNLAWSCRHMETQTTGSSHIHSQFNDSLNKFYSFASILRTQNGWKLLSHKVTQTYNQSETNAMHSMFVIPPLELGEPSSFILQRINPLYRYQKLVYLGLKPTLASTLVSSPWPIPIMSFIFSLRWYPRKVQGCLWFSYPRERWHVDYLQPCNFSSWAQDVTRLWVRDTTHGHWKYPFHFQWRLHHAPFWLASSRCLHKTVSATPHRCWSGDLQGICSTIGARDINSYHFPSRSLFYIFGGWEE